MAQPIPRVTAPDWVEAGRLYAGGPCYSDAFRPPYRQYKLSQGECGLSRLELIRRGLRKWGALVQAY